jgi:hypothetical protein
MPVLTQTGGGPGDSYLINSGGTLAPGFPPELTGLLQQGFLEREMKEGLDSVLAYRRVAIPEMIPSRVGETLTKTRKGRKSPVTAAQDPALNSGLDNGMTSSSFSIEQYQFTMRQYNDTVDVNLVEELAGIADQLIANARNSGVQAAQSLERIARRALFGAYLGGNTEADGTPTTSSVHVNDIRGFQFILSNGQLFPVSAATPLAVTEEIVAGGFNQTFNITGASPDGTNVSTTPDGISGTLTISPPATHAPTAGNFLQAANAPRIFRPLGKVLTSQLTGGDVFTMAMVEDVVAYLRDNGVPPMEDGTYHCILDNTTMRQLYADQDFKVVYAGRYQSDEFQNQDIIKLLGITFIPTTEAYVQTPLSSGGPKIRRPIIIGADALMEGDFEGMEIYLRNTQVGGSIAHVEIVNGIAQILRAPLDRLQQLVSLSWFWIGDFAVPSDLTATTSVIPTASNALYKRAAVIEVAG